jgi:hypothetical protein
VKVSAGTTKFVLNLPADITIGSSLPLSAPTFLPETAFRTTSEQLCRCPPWTSSLRLRHPTHLQGSPRCLGPVKGHRLRVRRGWRLAIRDRPELTRLPQHAAVREHAAVARVRRQPAAVHDHRHSVQRQLEARRGHVRSVAAGEPGVHGCEDQYHALAVRGE